MILHTFYTWVLANFLHPFVLVAFFFRSDFQAANFLSVLPVIFGVCLLLSLPSLFGAWYVLSLIRRLSFSGISRLLTWMFFASSAPYLNLVLLSFILEFELEGDLLKFIIPSTIATVLAVLIRIPQFFRLFTS